MTLEVAASGRDARSHESYLRLLRRNALLLFVSVATLAGPGAWAAVRVSFCQGQPGCICIDWDRGFSSWLEVGCPSGGGDSGWTSNPGGSPIDDPGGGWRGPGGDQPSDQPGNLLAPKVAFAWNQARDAAWSALRGDSNCCLAGKPYYTPNQCTLLFVGNPMGRMGADLVKNYIVPRGGEGVRASDGSVPCNSSSVSVWTTCCQHDPDVFVCDRFADLSLNTRTALVIHETMHVAGQPEDRTSTAGPDDPPTTNDITATVREACGL